MAQMALAANRERFGQPQVLTMSRFSPSLTRVPASNARHAEF